MAGLGGGCDPGDGKRLGRAKSVRATRLLSLCEPYAIVISLDQSLLPTVEQVGGWSGPEYAQAIRHDPACPHYNPNMRQLVHVGFKVAAQMDAEYLSALNEFAPVIAKGVKENILHRHLEKIFKM